MVFDFVKIYNDAGEIQERIIVQAVDNIWEILKSLRKERALLT